VVECKVGGIEQSVACPTNVGRAVGSGTWPARSLCCDVRMWDEGVQPDVEHEGRFVGAAGQPPCTDSGDIVVDVVGRRSCTGRWSGMDRSSLAASPRRSTRSCRPVWWGQSWASASSTRNKPGCGSSVSQATAVACRSQRSPLRKPAAMATLYRPGNRYDADPEIGMSGSCRPA
jgi:hypothetical protein